MLGHDPLELAERPDGLTGDHATDLVGVVVEQGGEREAALGEADAIEHVLDPEVIEKLDCGSELLWQPWQERAKTGAISAAKSTGRVAAAISSGSAGRLGVV